MDSVQCGVCVDTCSSAGLQRCIGSVLELCEVGPLGCLQLTEVQSCHSGCASDYACRTVDDPIQMLADAQRGGADGVVLGPSSRRGSEDPVH